MRPPPFRRSPRPAPHPHSLPSHAHLAQTRTSANPPRRRQPRGAPSVRPCPRHPGQPGNTRSSGATPSRRAVTSAFALALALLVALAGAACGSSDESPPATPTGAQSILGGSYPRFEDEDLDLILATPTLTPGSNRFAFVLSDDNGLIRLPRLHIASFLADSNEPAQEANARFYAFPLDIRGIYVSRLTFDQPGEWTVEVRIPRPSGEIERTRFAFRVRDETAPPRVGDLAPPSVSRTVNDVDNLQDLTTGATVDPALYQLSIRDALDNGRPTAVVFASPGFCTNALCGPQVEVLSQLHAEYGDVANYIHVELFADPTELRSGDVESAAHSPLIQEWGLDTDEWTFLIDPAGRVVDRFEAFTPIEELEPAFAALVGDAPND